MAIKFHWNILSLRNVNTPDFNNAVVNVRWEKVGTDSEGNEGVFGGSTPFKLSNLDPDNFVPFEELTEETVISWLESVVVGPYEDSVNQHIYKQIRNKREPGVEQTVMPWDPTGTPRI